MGKYITGVSASALALCMTGVYGHELRELWHGWLGIQEQRFDRFGHLQGAWCICSELASGACGSDLLAAGTKWNVKVSWMISLRVGC